MPSSEGSRPGRWTGKQLASGGSAFQRRVTALDGTFAVHTYVPSEFQDRAVFSEAENERRRGVLCLVGNHFTMIDDSWLVRI